MYNNPLISIITVVYNGASTLEQTILSVINQTYKNIEYIIIDGGSTDGTIDIIKKYEKHLACWVSEPDEGIYDAMNKGIDKATGEWIGLLNSGDVYTQDVLHIISQEVTNNPDIELFFGNMKIIHNKKYLRDEIFNGIIDCKMMNICHPTVFVKRDIYSIYGVFDKKFPIAADYDILLRFYKKHVKFKYLNIFITIFSIGGISSILSLKILKERFLIRKKNKINPISLKEIFIFLCLKFHLKKQNW
jgi:glycosyltransferase involved in cell wall biosynthesis